MSNRGNKSAPIEKDQKFALDLEEYKFQAVLQYTKLLVSLSTGGVLAIAIFLRELFTVPVAKWLLVVTVTAFSLSVISNMLFFSALVELICTRKESNWVKVFGNIWNSRVGQSTFFIGLLAITTFVVYNFFVLAEGP